MTCTRCKVEPSAGWPDNTLNKDGELCQMCWEDQCSESWWQMVMGQPVTEPSK